MKIKLGLVGFVLAGASVCFAQNYNMSTSTPPSRSSRDTSISSEGFRVTLVKSMLDVNSTVSSSGSNSNSSLRIDDTTGFSLGYISLPAQSVGWFLDASYLELKAQNYTVPLGRVDGGMAYAFDRFVHIKGGLNLSQYTKKYGSLKYSPGLGGMLALGLQFNQHFGLDIGYAEMHQTGTYNSTEASNTDFKVYDKFAGLEVGLTGTF